MPIANRLSDEWKKTDGFIIAHCPMLQLQGNDLPNSLVALVSLPDGSTRNMGFDLCKRIVAASDTLIDPNNPSHQEYIGRVRKLMDGFSEAVAAIASDPNAINRYPVYDLIGDVFLESPGQK